MNNIFEINNKSYEIKENKKSWTITLLDVPMKVTFKTNISKKDCKTLEEVKEIIKEIFKY